MINNIITIAGTPVRPGERKIIELPSAMLFTQTSVNIPIHVINGKKKGPKVFVTAAVHGDEINSMEIVRLLATRYSFKNLRGTLILIPVANIYGFITRSRYLPDRRDLNRSFPGSKAGSLAARLADLLMQEVISHCTHGIDLHTGNQNSDNLPQIRANLENVKTLHMAKAFNVPVIIDAKIRDGSIRQAATELNIPVLIYEGGEALRFNELAIQVGLQGVLHVLAALKMIQPKGKKNKAITPKIARSSAWVRSPTSGIVHSTKALGSYVKKGDLLAVIADPFAKTKEIDIPAPVEGLVIGRNTLPLVNEGDALFHLANIKSGKLITAQYAALEADMINNPLVLL